MIEEKKVIQKLVLTPGSIEAKDNWQISQRYQLTMCHECHSNLFYFEPVYGIVAEKLDFGIMHYKEQRQFRIIKIGLNIYCAECGTHNENYYKWFYPENSIIMTFDEIDDAEQHEVQHCLNQFNEKHDFTSSYHYIELNELKRKLKEYVKNNPLKKKETKKK